MIYNFSQQDLNAISCLFSDIGFTIYFKNKDSRFHGFVNFKLVKCGKAFLIERTYVPGKSWRKASKRYVSLDSFLASVHSAFVKDMPINDIPF